MTTTSPAITTRVAGVDDAALLTELARSSFIDTFESGNTPENMRLYLASAFGESIQRSELSDSRHTVFLAERNGEIVGYAMLRNGPAPECVKDPDAIEIVRLYSVKHHIGAGIGATLMQRCLDEAARLGKSSVWLGVWEHNPRAIAFYRRWDFSDVGAHTFQLGNDRQTDRVMSRRVAP